MLMKFIKTPLTPVLFLLFVVAACVPQRKFQEVEDKLTQCEEDLSNCKSKSQTLEAENADLKEQVEDITKNMTALRQDTTVLGTSLRQMRTQYDKINKLNDELLRKHADLQRGSQEENRKLLADLESTKEELQKREDALRVLEAELDKKKANLEVMGEELKKREKKVNELEDLIKMKDEAVKQLQDKIAKALLSFRDKGLTVEEKNGKVYVSLEAKLLFASGSTAVGAEGKRALIELAKVLQDQDDLEVLVEGHTDTDQIRSSSIPRDNWELSVLRATSVVKIMTENSDMDPRRLIAAGRSEFNPLDPDDKAKNRRIEVILTPRLDELFKLIEGGN